MVYLCGVNFCRSRVEEPGSRKEVFLQSYSSIDLILVKTNRDVRKVK